MDERCLPILKTVKKYDAELAEWKVSYKNFRLDYEEDKENTRARIGECTKEIANNSRWTAFEKKYNADLLNTNQDLDTCSLRLNKIDAYNDRNT